MIATIEGPDKQRYSITEHLFSDLRKSLSSYYDVVLLHAEESITAIDGSKKARDLGERHQADLVIWGWYGVTESDALLNIYIENLMPPNVIPLETTELHPVQVEVAQINHFQLQRKLSGEMSALTVFVTGIVRYEARDYAEALKRFGSTVLATEWAEDVVNQAYLYFYLGNTYFELKDSINAIAAYTEAIGYAPSTSSGYFNRALLYFGLDSLTDAIDDLNSAIRCDPSLSDAYAVRGRAYFRLEKYRNAIDDFTSVLVLLPDNIDSFLDRGSCYLKEKRYREAEKDFSEAIRREPENFYAFYNRGVTRSAMGDCKGAIEDYARAIQITPEDPVPYNNLGICYAHLDSVRKAIACYDRAIELDSRFPEAHCNRANAYSFLGDYGRAIKDYDASIRIDSTSAEAYYGRGKVYLILRLFIPASLDLRKAASITHNPRLRIDAEARLREIESAR